MSRLEFLIQQIRHKVTEITTANMPMLIQEPHLVIIDIREASEYQKEHAKDAIHICKGLIECKIEANVPDADTPILLYCGGGTRSIIAAESLQRMGYTNVMSLIGGYKAWKEANLP